MAGVNGTAPAKEEKSIMQKLTLWICSSLLAAVSVAPVLAGTKDATDAKTSAETTANPATANPASGNPAAQPAAAANPKITPVAGNANVTALLGVLVMKGVLAPAEANAIRDAAPDAEFQLLVEALARKGVVSAADLSAAATPAPAAQPVPTPAPVPTPSPAPAPVALAVAAAQAPAPKETKPAGPVFVPAVAPLRVLPLDPPVKDGLIPGFQVGAV